MWDQAVAGKRGTLAFEAGKRMCMVAIGLSADRLSSSKTAAGYLWMRAEPPLAKALTWSSVAMVVSPGNVVSNAP